MSPEIDRLGRIAAFEEMERRHRLFDVRVDGWSAWRIVRFPLFLAAIELPLARSSRSTIARSLEALKATAGYLWLLMTAPRRELVIKTARSALRLHDGQKYRDLFFDGLIERGHSCLKLEEINSPNFARQAAAAFRPSDLDPVLFTFWGRVLGKLFPVDTLDFCEHAAALMQNDIGVKVDPNWLRMLMSTVYWQSRIYGALLSRVKPRAVLIAETGSYALRIAASRRRIPVVELQHGVFDADHPDAVPLWAEGTAAELVLPDVQACYGAFWIERLAGTYQGDARAAAVGNELIDRARANIGKTEIRHLVVTSQGIDDARFARWLGDVIACAPAGLAWRMSVKLHPLSDMNAREFDALKSDSRIATIAGPDNPNVYELLAGADVHLSIGSACHFDAAALGVPTVIAPLAGHEPLLKLVDGRTFFHASQPSDVWRVPERSERQSADVYRYAAPGFVDNLEGVLRSLPPQAQAQKA